MKKIILISFIIFPARGLFAQEKHPHAALQHPKPAPNRKDYAAVKEAKSHVKDNEDQE